MYMMCTPSTTGISTAVMADECSTVASSEEDVIIISSASDKEFLDEVGKRTEADRIARAAAALDER
jgi:hypothetical protein